MQRLSLLSRAIWRDKRRASVGGTTPPPAPTPPPPSPSPSPPSGDTITPAVTVTKGASGAAPLMVWFDSGDTTSTVITTKPWQRIQRYWNFGDQFSGVWQTGTYAGVASKNVDTGPIAGHSYTRAGTYQPILMTFDGTSANVLLLDPITVVAMPTNGGWDGAKTLLVSNTGNFTCAGLTGSPATVNPGTGANAIAAVVTAFNTAAALAPAGAVRILFREGESFSCDSALSSTFFATQGGPVMISSYNDSGPQPETTNHAIIAAASTVNGFSPFKVGITSVGYNTMNDWRIVGIKIDCSAVPRSQSVYGLAMNGTCDNLLIKNVPIVGVSWLGFDFNYARLSVVKNSRGFHIQTGIAIEDCPQSGQRTGSSGGLVVNTWGYLNGKLMWIAGNDMNARGDDEAASHCFRAFHYEKLAFVHNSVAYPGTGRHCMKFHSGEVIAWGLNSGAGTGAFTPSSTSNSGSGDLRRPYNPVSKGLWARDAMPQTWRCTTSGLTGATEPTWNLAAGSTTTDGAAVWTECTAAFLAGTVVPEDVSLRDNTFGTEKFYSSELYVAHNRVTGGGWSMGVGPLDDDDYSLAYRSLIERNWFLATPLGIAQLVSQHIAFWGREGDIRYNLFDGGGGSNLQMIYAGHRNASNASTYVARDVDIYNNTGFCDSTGSSSLAMVATDSEFARNVVGKNNVLVNTSGKTGNITSGTGHPSFPASFANNLHVTSDPGFAGSGLAAEADWRITASGSPTKDAGVTMPVFFDFYDAPVPGGAAIDIGANEQGTPSSITFLWELPIDPDTGVADATITHQVVYWDTVSRGPDGGYKSSHIVADGTTTTYVIPGLLSGVTYYMSVTAFNANGEGGYADEISTVAP